MRNFKVLMSDTVFGNYEIEKDVVEKHGGTFVFASDKNPETLVREGKDCDAVINVLAKIPAEVIAGWEKCKVIVRTGIGYNNIDVAAASTHGVMVANVPDYCLDEVADHTFSLLLACLRKVVFLNNDVRAGFWDPARAKPIYRLQGKTLGLYGFGNIGQRVAKRALAFGMDVWAFDPFVPEREFAACGVRQVTELNKLFSNSDFLSLHAPATTENRNLINLSNLETMKSSAYLINTSRGELVNETELEIALERGIIAGAALDVLAEEPPKRPLALARFDNVIITPHAAYYSEEATPDLRNRAAIEIVRTLREGSPKNWVNRQTISNRRQ